MNKIIEENKTMLTVTKSHSEAKQYVPLDLSQETFTYEHEQYDRLLHAFMSQFIGWLSPSAFLLAFSDWFGHLQNSPGRQADIAVKAMQNVIQFSVFSLDFFFNAKFEPSFKPRQNDHRFDNSMWREFPFIFYYQYFLMIESIIDDMTSKIHGVSKHHHSFVNFMTRQMIDIFAPSNCIYTNPEVLSETINQNGLNFIKGFTNYIEDIKLHLNKQLPAGTEKFQVGKNVAVTPGKVIFRNRLIELIQYEPVTSTVYAEPILIVPAWIMKYYILDLSRSNSMVKYLVDQGHTVFMISWKNPTSDDRNLGLEEYVNLGILSAIDVINAVLPERKIHAVGYCIGGTLLMIAAAALAKESDERLKTISLFAAQVDFTDAGELSLLIDEAQINYLEDLMWQKGFLDGAQMAGTFSMLRSADLIFSRAIHDYLIGNRRPINDLMAWDYDTTRLPYKMHTEYLKKLFLNNELAQGQFQLGGSTISLLDITAPIFSVGTQYDHVAPWKSVFKIHFYTNVEITFVLTSGGHNSGIVSEPGHIGRTFQLMVHKKEDKHMTADTWRENASRFEGSWWLIWEDWLANYSTNKVEPPPMGNPEKGYRVLRNAPGCFVFEK